MVEKDKKYCFQISDLNICLESEIPLNVTIPFYPFISRGEADYVISFHMADQLPTPNGVFVYRGDIFSVFKDIDSKYERCFFQLNHPKDIYAVGFYNYFEKQMDIYYLNNYGQHFSETGNSFFHIGWESILLREKRMILHACCVDTAYGGILFSGPSGIGKSTQGDLWCQHEDARPINGDRPILYKAENIWYAYGSPYAGSSDVYVNDRTPVRTIVLLDQARKCSIAKLGMAEAFRSVYAMTTVCDWDEVCTQNVCDLITDLVTKIPVYKMKCTPDVNAVELLKATISDEEDN